MGSKSESIGTPYKQCNCQGSICNDSELHNIKRFLTCADSCCNAFVSAGICELVPADLNNEEAARRQSMLYCDSNCCVSHGTFRSCVEASRRVVREAVADARLSRFEELVA